MYMIFDLETQIHQRFKRKANPFLKENYVVLRGWKSQGEEKGSYEHYRDGTVKSYLSIPDNITLLVGLNIKFDLLYEMVADNPDLRRFFERGGKVWCCQYAEYLIQGMVPESHMVSMDQIVEKYGGHKKIDEVKLLWEQGIQTSEIPLDLLVDYLVGPEYPSGTEQVSRSEGDIGNTEMIFRGQVAEARKQGMIKMIQDRMDGLLCTTEMEFRGLRVDIPEATARLKVLTEDLNETDKRLDAYLPELPFEFKWGSGAQVSAFIFGGSVKYKERDFILDEHGNKTYTQAVEKWPLVDGQPTHPDKLGDAVQDTFTSGLKKGMPKFKNVKVPGEVKTKIFEKIWDFPRMTEPDKSWKLDSTDARGNAKYGTGGDIIEALGMRDIPFLKDFSRKAALDKEIGTYYVKKDEKTGEYKGMLTCVQPWDYMLHHKLNHTSTVTGRLSSSDPNMQNVPRGDKSEVKKMFISRFTEAYCKYHGIPYRHIGSGKSTGVKIEADYSQLEVVVQQVLSGDQNMKQYLIEGKDFHCIRVAAVHNLTYEESVYRCKTESYKDYAAWNTIRTETKGFSFQRAYGAGANAISAATGMTIDAVEALIKAEDEMFPGVAVFNDKVAASCTATAYPIRLMNPENKQWETFRRGYWVAPTGTKYVWRTHPSPAFMRKQGIMDTFSPPEQKNYPVQGTGGEFVQAMLGRLWRHFVSKQFYGGKAFLVNTVHDCIWVDCHIDVLDEVAADIKRIMQSIPEYYKERYGMNIEVPFPVDVECGFNMLELHSVEKFKKEYMNAVQD